MGQITHTQKVGHSRVKGIEPSSLAWEANALPLSYTRKIKSGNLPRLISIFYTMVVASARWLEHVIYDLARLFWMSSVSEQQKLFSLILHNIFLNRCAA